MGKANQELRENRLRALGLRGKLPDALTEKVLDAVQSHPTGERYKIVDGEVPGLALQVAADGAASFLLQYRNSDGAQRTLKVAAAGAMPLEAVRKLARTKLEEVGRGADPTEEKRAARARTVNAERSTLRAYLANIYGPEVLAHQKGGGAPVAAGKNGEPAKNPSGSWARILHSWAPLLDKPLPALTRADIEKVLADRKKKAKSAGTLLRDWSSFRALMADAVDRGVMPAIPMARRPEPIRKLRGTQRVRWLGQLDTEKELANKQDERSRFVKALDAFTEVQSCSGDLLRFAVRLALATGLRRGEIVRLTDNMINLRERTITLPAAITKSNRSRIVYLHDGALAALESWKVRGTKGELCPGSAEMWEDRITQQGFPALCAAAGITDLHFHDLRHDFAVRMLRSGATLGQVREALGHASITQTEKYAHIVPSDVRRAVLALQMA